MTFALQISILLIYNFFTQILTEEYFKFDDAVVLQPPTVGQKCAVFSGSTPLARDLTGFNYVFYLPMTAMAWRRIGEIPSQWFMLLGSYSLK